jgi:hypothetical protein
MRTEVDCDRHRHRHRDRDRHNQSLGMAYNAHARGPLVDEDVY